MTNVTAFPKQARVRKARSQGQGFYFVEGGPSSSGPWVLAEIEEHEDKAVVRVAPLASDPVGAPKRKYVVDTVLEAFRLAYRVHGFNNVMIRQVGPKEYRVHNPPVRSGPRDATA